MPPLFHYLRVRVKTEQHRLGNWALVANLTEQSGSLSTSLQLNEALVQEVLREQETILTGFWKISHPHTLMVDDPNPDLSLVQRGNPISKSGFRTPKAHLKREP